MNGVISAILPVFLVAGCAYGMRRKVSLDARTLANLNLYLLIPALVYSSVSRQPLDWPVFGRIALGALLMLVAMTVLLGLIGRSRGLAGPELSAFMMTMFMNLGNFGLPVAKFAFGEPGLAIAVVVMVCGSFLQNSVGIYFAQRSRHGVTKSFLQMFRFPMIYTFALGIAAQQFEWELPVALTRAIDICGEGAIPLQLMILGIQLAETPLDTSANVFLATGMRLCAGPVLAFLIARGIGMDGLPAKVFVQMMSGPVAIGMGAFGIQFNVAPRFLSSVVALTFLLSLITVTAVLMALNLM